MTSVSSPKIIRRSPFGDNPTVGRRGADTQRRILRVALDVFAEHGYHGTRVELITAAAGCSRPAFYQYFPSKEDLFWTLAGHLANEMGELAEGIGAVTADAAGIRRLTGWIEALIDLQDDYDPVLSGFQAATRDRRPERTSFRSIGGRVGSALIESTEPPHPELGLPALTNTIVGVLFRSIHYWHRGLGQLPRERFVTGMARTTHRLLHGAVQGVNVTETMGSPPRRRPQWPTFPEVSRNGASRPRGQKTRQSLLDAGTVVLPRRGYNDTRVDDIVQAAGVSHGTFYRYFSNKDELVHELAQRAAVSMVELIDTFPPEGDAEAVRSWLDGWFRAYRDNGGVISAWQEIQYEDPVLVAFSLDVAMVAFDRLTRIIHRRGFGDATVDAIALLAVIERIPYNVLVLRHLDEDEALEASAFIVRRGLFGLDV